MLFIQRNAGLLMSDFYSLLIILYFSILIGPQRLYLFFQILFLESYLVTFNFQGVYLLFLDKV